MTIPDEQDLEALARRTARSRALARRVAALGATTEQAEAIVAGAVHRAGGASARLSAALAMVQALVGGGRIPHGGAALQVLEDLLTEPDTYIPTPFWRDALPGGAEGHRSGGGSPPTPARLGQLRMRTLTLLAAFASGAFPSGRERGRRSSPAVY